MAESIPTATLAVESLATNPRRPISIGVFVDGKLIALVPLEEFRTAAEKLAAYG